MARAKDPDRSHLLGIRHHGPGSARSVLAALDAAAPAIVLIEGPPDADLMIPFAASDAMVPPVALLVHAQDDPANSSFFPFAEFSPEWQALRWALARARPVRFIDLPMSIRLAERAAARPQTAEPGADSADGSPAPEPALAVPAPKEPAAESGPDPSAAETDQAATDQLASVRRDPLGYLAQIAGYDDGEAWWNALIEQGAHGPEIFTAIEAAMTALRSEIDVTARWPEAEARVERQREAHMRLALADALAETSGAVAVVCGAWHVPALRAKVAAKDDRALLKGLAKIKVTATWVPWTETRLATHSGYGAGVVSPGWYAHLWREQQRPNRDPEANQLAANSFAARWQARVAALLRKSGRPASTASVIEASRLALSLAALRDLALPGLDEMREASLATLCEGETTPFRLIEQQLVIGQRVGEIDDGVPQMPLAADLARWQRRLKLEPEALDTDISLDLRSEAGLAKSLLLHRLRLINLPWGQALGAGTSRGTFRENWRLRWEPEFSVRLAEALVHGTTVELAASNAAIATATSAKSLDGISLVVRGCLDAGLADAANATIIMLQRQAAASSDIAALASAVPPLADILRYGTARAIPVEPLRLLVTSMTEAVCAGLVYAARNLQAEAAAEMRSQLRALDVAMALIDDAGLTTAWQRALGQMAADGAAHPLLAGFAVRVLYDHGQRDAAVTALDLSRALSPSVPPMSAGDWLDGFLGQNGQILLHDAILRRIIDGWLISVGEDDFTNLLPVLRRGFSAFDRSERRKLLDDVTKLRLEAAVITPHAEVGADRSGHAPGFAAALPLLLTILGADPAATTQGTSP